MDRIDKMKYELFNLMTTLSDITDSPKEIIEFYYTTLSEFEKTKDIKILETSIIILRRIFEKTLGVKYER